MTELDMLVELLKEVVSELLTEQENDLSSQIKLDFIPNTSIHCLGGNNDKNA